MPRRPTPAPLQTPNTSSASYPSTANHGSHSSVIPLLHSPSSRSPTSPFSPSSARRRSVSTANGRSNSEADLPRSSSISVANADTDRARSSSSAYTSSSDAFVPTLSGLGTGVTMGMGNGNSKGKGKSHGRKESVELSAVEGGYSSRLTNGAEGPTGRTLWEDSIHDEDDEDDDEAGDSRSFLRSASRAPPVEAFKAGGVGRTIGGVGWKKLALILAIVMGLLWLLGPKERRQSLYGYAEEEYNVRIKGSGRPSPSGRPVDFDGSDPSAVHPGAKPTSTATHTVSAPHQPALDLSKEVRVPPALHEDPLKTTRCMTPFPGKPLVQYALMIDAGSTGSRIHIYKFNYCKPAPELEQEIFEPIKGGLSNYKDDPVGAAQSLRPLLNKAIDAVPESLRKCSPIAVKATAGLRLLGASQSDAILKAVRKMLEDEFPFPVRDQKKGKEGGDGVQIMDGKDEGVFAWITINYLLNRIGEGTAGKKTAAVMDLGGASTQIVFEPSFPDDSQLAEGDHKYELNNFGGKDFTLYQNSYLGFGLMRARRAINNLAAFSWFFAQPKHVLTGEPLQWDDLNPSVEVPNSCFAKGYRKVVELDPPGRKKVNVTFTGTGGGVEACRRLVEVIMGKDAMCANPPCSFAGVYQPSLTKTFSTSPIIALSYFYDRLSPLGLAPTYTVGQLANLSRDVCADPSTWRQNFGHLPNAMSELEDRPMYCGDLTFQHALLSLGYELPEERQIVSEKKLGGIELGWCLGAVIDLLDGEGLECKV